MCHTIYKYAFIGNVSCFSESFIHSQTVKTSTISVDTYMCATGMLKSCS